SRKPLWSSCGKAAVNDRLEDSIQLSRDSLNLPAPIRREDHARREIRDRRGPVGIFIDVDADRSLETRGGVRGQSRPAKSFGKTIGTWFLLTVPPLPAAARCALAWHTRRIFSSVTARSRASATVPNGAVDFNVTRLS